MKRATQIRNTLFFFKKDGVVDPRAVQTASKKKKRKKEKVRESESEY